MHDQSTPSFKPADIARFWSRVDRSGGPDACWTWTASLGGTGYGQIRIAGVHWRANRLAWVLTHGPIPDDIMVLHNCPDGDNPLCVNPAHLWLGAHDDNMADKTAKGRGAMGDRHGRRTQPERTARGSGHGNAVLTEEIVLEMKAAYVAGGINQTALAKRYGINQGHMTRILSGKSWAHVGDGKPVVRGPYRRKSRLRAAITGALA